MQCIFRSAGSAIKSGEHCNVKMGWYSITCVLVGTRRVMIRDEVWVGEREGMVISLRDRRASVCLILPAVKVSSEIR